MVINESPFYVVLKKTCFSNIVFIAVKLISNNLNSWFYQLGVLRKDLSHPNDLHASKVFAMLNPLKTFHCKNIGNSTCFNQKPHNKKNGLKN